MKPDQTKLVGGALAIILVWIYQCVADLTGLPEMPAEVATAISVIIIALLDRFLSDPARATSSVPIGQQQPVVNLPPGAQPTEIIVNPQPPGVPS